MFASLGSRDSLTSQSQKVSTNMLLLKCVHAVENANKDLKKN
jgi:hypothetical protein